MKGWFREGEFCEVGGRSRMRRAEPVPGRGCDPMMPGPGSKSRRALAMAACLTAAAWIAGAGPDPFQGPYRLKVTEPLEGATLSSASVRVTAELEPRPQTTPAAPAKDATPTPRPRIEVFLDGDSKGVLKDGQSTLTLDGVAAGTHTILVTATEPAGSSVVDRKEIHFTVLEPR
jgi:hypothetical protein